MHYDFVIFKPIFVVYSRNQIGYIGQFFNVIISYFIHQHRIE